MKMMKNGLVVDMTEEDIERIFGHNEENAEATEQDYINALARLGVE